MASRRLFLDTNVFVRAHIETGSPSADLLSHAINGTVVVVASAHLVDEVSRYVRAQFGRNEAYRMRSMILAFPSLRVVDKLEWERRLPGVIPKVRDRTDAPHFAAARAGGAEVFVSYNRRSVFSEMFDIVPLVTPEHVLPALEGKAPWPTKEQLKVAWDKWAEGSRRAPK